jgi:hypothetical protein
MEMSFTGGPREVKRIIVRSAKDISVDKLKEAKFTLYKVEETAEIPFDLPTQDDCVVHINLAGANQTTKAVALETDKIRMDFISFHIMNKAQDRAGFKIDVFIKDIVLPEYPVTEDPLAASNQTTLATSN